MIRLHSSAVGLCGNLGSSVVLVGSLFVSEGRVSFTTDVIDYEIRVLTAKDGVNQHWEMRSYPRFRTLENARKQLDDLHTGTSGTPLYAVITRGIIDGEKVRSSTSDYLVIADMLPELFNTLADDEYITIEPVDEP